MIIVGEEGSFHMILIALMEKTTHSPQAIPPHLPKEITHMLEAEIVLLTHLIWRGPV